MAIYMNMDRKYIRSGGRNAVTMPLEQFKELFSLALQRYDDDDSGWTPDNMEDYEKYRLESMLLNALSEYYMVAPFNKVRKDIDKIQVAYENVVLKEFVVTSTGVPAARLLIGGDWEKGITAYVYFDGKAFRGYVPLYGNAYDRASKCAFGSEPHCKKTYVITSDSASTKLFYEGDMTVNETGVPQSVTLTEEDYEEFNWCEVEANNEACLEDFTARMTVVGQLQKGEYDKAVKKFEKLNETSAIDEADDCDW